MLGFSLSAVIQAKLRRRLCKGEKEVLYKGSVDGLLCVSGHLIALFIASNLSRSKIEPRGQLGSM